MNNSKQTILSIVGIAILVIAVVGVSFAFFTYSRTGTKNNVITTGSIVFEYEEDTESALNLTNQFPQTDTAGANNAKFKFDVKGTVPTTANPISYKVYVVRGANDDEKTRFADSEISIKATVAAHSEEVNNETVTSSTNGFVEIPYQTAGPLTNIANTSTNPKGIQIAHGTISNTGDAQQHDYTLTMWVNNTVTISDTDYSKTYRAKAYDAQEWPEKPANDVENASPRDLTKMPFGQANDDRTVYTNLYYSVKVNVEADDTVTQQP